MKEVTFFISYIEDFKYAKTVLTEKEINILKSSYKIDYDEKNTIKDILNFYVYSLKEYFNEFNKKSRESKDDELKEYFRIIYMDNKLRIFDLNTPIYKILEIQKNSILNFAFIIGVGGGFDALQREDGIQYSMNTREQGKHNFPHLHVKYSGEEVVINILTGQTIEGYIKSQKQKEAMQKIKENKEELMLLWNTRTDGKKFDIKTSDMYSKI